MSLSTVVVKDGLEAVKTFITGLRSSDSALFGVQHLLHQDGSSVSNGAPLPVTLQGVGSVVVPVSQSGSWTVAVTGPVVVTDFDQLLARVGATSDTKVTSGSSSGSVIALLKGILDATGGGGGGGLSGGPVTETDASGTITAGGTAQTAIASNTSRSFLKITNPHQSDDLWFSTTGTAAVNGSNGSVLLPAGTGIVFDLLVPTGAVSVISATTGRPFTVTHAS